MNNLRSRIDIFHDKNHIFDSQTNRRFDALHSVFLIKDQLHELRVGLQSGEWHIHNGTLSVLGQHFDH
eukprot:Skav212351  [mRNA]  locus=scaffold3038:12223:12790:- [translate_table: standard]